MVTESGATPLSALLSQATSDLSGFVYNGAANDLATEQGFRALVAYQGLKNTGAAYNVYTQAKLGQAALPAEKQGDVKPAGAPAADRRRSPRPGTALRRSRPALPRSRSARSRQASPPRGACALPMSSRCADRIAAAWAKIRTKTGGSGVETLEPRERGKIARRSHRPLPRLAARRASGRASAPAASEPARRRPRKALLAVGVAASAIALCAIVASMGFATGWLGDPVPSDPVPMPSVVTDAPSDGDDASQGDEADRKDAAEEASEGADGEAGAAVDGEGAADADGSAASTAGEAPSGTEPSASEGAAAPGSGACARAGPGAIGPQHRHGVGVHRQLPRRVQWLPLILGRRHGHPQPGRIRRHDASALPERRWAGRAATSAPSAALRNSLAVRQRLAVFRQRIVARIRVRFVYPKRWRKHYVDIHLRFGQRPVDVRVEESEAPCSAIESGQDRLRGDLLRRARRPDLRSSKRCA